MYEFSVLLKPAPDLKGQWVAHCLNWDLISQGDSFDDARKMVVEAIVMAINEDHADGVDPGERSSAPDKVWAEFRTIQDRGQKVSIEMLKEVSDLGKYAVAAVIYMYPMPKKVQTARSAQPSVPPPFMIAALQESNQSAHM